MTNLGRSYTITGRIVHTATGKPLSGLRVEAWDKDLIVDDLIGNATTDKKGDFRITFDSVHFQELFVDRHPDLFFRIFDDDKCIHSTEESVLWNAATSEYSLVIQIDAPDTSPPPDMPILTPLPITNIPLAEVVRAAGIDSAVLEKIKLSTIQDLFSRKGMEAVQKIGLSAEDHRRLLGVAKFAAASGSVSLSQQLVDKGLTSLSQLGRVPLSRIQSLLGNLDSKEQQAVKALKAAGQTIGNLLLDTSIRWQRLTSADANWYTSARDHDLPFDPGIEIEPNLHLCDIGNDCFTVFSPIAYIFDLLGFIHDNWNIASNALESIIYQEIDSLNCNTGFELIPQIRLGIETLEKYMAADLPIDNVTWANAYYRACEQLLALAGLKADDLSAESIDNLTARYPTPATLNHVVEAVRHAYGVLIDQLIVPNVVPSNDPVQNVRNQASVEQQRQNARLELEDRLNSVVLPVLRVYRETLIAATGEQVNRLENRLFIDLRSSPTLFTNRITQAIQSLQSFILAIRTGEIREYPRDDVAALFASPYTFDDATWTWLGEYATWSSAMYALIYPENVITMPVYRPSITYGFNQAIKSLRQPMSRERAEMIQQEYDRHLQIINSIELLDAHIVEEKLYLLGKADNEVWMNTTPLPVTRWDGWQPTGIVGATSEKGRLVGVQRFGESRDNLFVAMYLRGKVTEAKSVDCYWISREGSIDAEAPFLRVDIDGRVIRDEVTVSEQIMFNDSDVQQLEFVSVETRFSYPVIRVKGNLDGEERLFVAAVYSSDARWSLDRVQRPAGARGLVPIGGSYYYVGNRIHELRVMNSSGTLLFSVDLPLENISPDVSHVFRPFILATNLNGNATVIIRIIPFHHGGQNWHSTFRTVSTTLDIATGTLGETWTGVCASKALMEEALIGALAASGMSGTAIPDYSSQIYFEERYFFLPLLIAWAFNRVGDYISAHDWYRKLYDPFTPDQKYGFPFDTYFTGDFSRSDDWLADPLNPYTIAAQRRGVYLRHNILMMVKNLLDWADHEFARSGPESINQARELYLLAERILKAPELQNLCLQGLSELRIEIVERFGVEADILIPGFSLMASINFSDIVDATSRVIKEIIGSNTTLVEISRIGQDAVREAIEADRLRRNAKEIGSAFSTVAERNEALESKLFQSGVLQLLHAHPANGFVESSPNLGSASLISIAFSIPPNPLLTAFAYHIEASLAKIHTDLNIAADWIIQSPRQSGSSLSDLMAIPNDLMVGFIDPPRYRYSYLAEKARQQASLAQQLGAELLQAIEKGDAAAFERLQAEHSLSVAEITVTLRNLSWDAVVNAKLVSDQQKLRAGVQRSFWNKRLENGYTGGFLGFGVGGLSEAELLGMGLAVTSGMLQIGAGLIYGSLVLPAILGAASSGLITTAGGIATMGGAIATSSGGIPGALVAGGGSITAAGGLMAMGMSVMAGGPMLAASLQSFAGASGTFGGLALQIASFQRRWEEWKLQDNLATIDQTIADLQVAQSQIRVSIAEQDKQIADLYHTHATQALNFLKTKFSNQELYEWIRDVLLEQYKIVMQIATSTALQAQRALEFERQEPITIIADDYWTIDSSTLSAANLTDIQRSTGLLGAERLLTALTQLDNNKLQKDRRHLEISKTISLARLMPTELIEFRQTGKITFNTLMDWFDRDFPGHYLRLIKSVKVSILALVPPIEGMHAILSNSGASSVVVNEAGNFVKKRAMRTFGEVIALDGAYNDTGLFVLDYNDAMFLPFEGLGVETQWSLELPTATNRFNFDTIADVLLTIEYTALYNALYAQQVRARLGETETVNTLIDIASSYSDEWYRVKNPYREPGSHPAEQELKLSIPRVVFPPHLLDAPPLNTNEFNMLLIGDFKGQTDEATNAIRDALRHGITVSKDGTPFMLASVFFDNYALFFTRDKGLVLCESWTNVPGNAVSDIPLNMPPDRTDVLASIEIPINWNNRYGSRIRGYITPPISGRYTFWVASDDQSELWLSTDDTVGNKRMIASVPHYTSPHEWNKYPEQKSDPTDPNTILVANQRYYVEVLHKEGIGGDHVAVGWLKPGETGSAPSVISGASLSLFTEPGSAGLPTNTNPIGDWTIHLNPELYTSPATSVVLGDDRKPIIDRMSDILLVLTVTGHIRW